MATRTFSWEVPGDTTGGAAGSFSQMLGFSFEGISKASLENIQEKTGPAFISILKFESANSIGKQMYVSRSFFLQGLNEVNQERSQVLETFGDPILLFFGNRTRVYSMTGTLLDADKDEEDDRFAYQWASAFKLFYDNYLRGSVLAKEQQIAALVVNGNAYFGYPINFTVQTDARMPMLSNFAMNWIIVKHAILPPVGAGNSADFIDGLSKSFDSTRVPASIEAQTKARALNEDIARLRADITKNENEIRLIESGNGPGKDSWPLDIQTRHTNLKAAIEEAKTSLTQKLNELGALNVS